MSSVNNNYSAVAKFFHWSVALLIIGNFIGGITLDSHHLYTLHKQSGLVILSLAILRLLWRIVSKYPEKIKTTPIEVATAKLVQLLLYILIFAIPISGILMVQAKGYSLDYFGLFQIPTFIQPQIKAVAHDFKEVHKYLAFGIIGLVCLHIIGAFKNHYFNRNNVLRRMLPKFMSKKIND